MRDAAKAVISSAIAPALQSTPVLSEGEDDASVETEKEYKS